MKNSKSTFLGELLQNLVEASLPTLTGEELDLLIERLESEAIRRVMQTEHLPESESVLLH